MSDFVSRNIGFFFGVGYSVIAVLFANVISYRSFREPRDLTYFCDPCNKEFGFPVSLYEQGRWADEGNIIWSGLVLDVLFTLVLCVLAGLATQVIGEKIFGGKSRY